MTTHDKVPTETSHRHFKQFFDEAVEDRWVRVFKRVLRRHKDAEIIMIQCRGLGERLQLETRGWVFDSVGTSLYNAGPSVFNMKIQRTKLEAYLAK